MKLSRKIIQIDQELCNGCGQCIPNCAEGALKIVNGKARLVAEKYCDGLGACLGECPTGALTVIERIADDFDEKAVHELLQAQEKRAPEPTACVCQSARLQSFQPLAALRPADPPAALRPLELNGSALSHWPIQIRLVPPTAPFLKGADLLIAADCTPVAYPEFHRDLLPGRVILMGCPKFDDSQAYVEKFTEIFAAATLKHITIAIMEVPCCAAMRMIVKEALKRSKTTIAVDEVVISARGELLSRTRLS